MLLTFLFASGTPTRSVATPAVVDVDSENSPLGIEVLQASKVFGGGQGELPSAFRLDTAADAAYLRLRQGSVLAQVVVEATFSMDASGELATIELDADELGSSRANPVGGTAMKPDTK